MAPFANLSFHAMVILSLISAYFTWQHFSNSPILEFRSEISQHYVCEGTERPTKKVAIIGKLQICRQLDLQNTKLRPIRQGLVQVAHPLLTTLSGLEHHVNH